MCVHPPLWVYDTNAPLWVCELLTEGPLINNGFLVQWTSTATHSLFNGYFYINSMSVRWWS